jgi:hypothetical protein
VGKAAEGDLVAEADVVADLAGDLHRVRCDAIHDNRPPLGLTASSDSDLRH